MKKFIGPICSILMGTLTFVFASITYLTEYVKGLDTTTGYNVWKIFDVFDSNVDGYVFFKIATIALIVLASLLIISGLILLLCNTKVIKTKVNFNLINNCLLTLAVVANVLGLIAGIIMTNYLTNALIIAKLGVGLWLNLAFSISVCLLAWIFAKTVKASKKKR
ncbi:MAG: hypothetical protein K6F08_00435 [bacterium]|nr:hypothetical protein [bacterium]